MRVKGIGTMSGTSMDGLDLVYAEFEILGDHYSFEVLAAETLPFEEMWRSRLSNLHLQSAEIFAKTHVYFGHWLGKAIQHFIQSRSLEPDFVAIHGQTIFHQPDKTFTFQIGDGETVAAYLPCPLVSNFRNKDLALGGQGAPLVPLGEQYLFPDYQLFLNLGGISNLSYQGIGFDISSCNGILNDLYQKGQPNSQTDYDPGGQLAAQGALNSELLEILNSIPYYQQQPPKSLGREWTDETMLPIVEAFDIPLADKLHTLVQHMAEQIALAVEQVGAKGEKMLVTGGGRHHSFLMEKLRDALVPLSVEIPELNEREQFWVDYKEALVFGLLGLHTLLGRPTTLASVTGAPYDVVTGSIHLPPKGGFSFFSLT